MMKAKDFRQEQGYPYNHFTKLTSTGISPDYEHIEEFAEAYHQSKVKTLGLFSVSNSKAAVCQCKTNNISIVFNGTAYCEDCELPKAN